MADLIIITGPQAVGKMTVAESLRDKIHYNFMMNHDSIEISDRIFGFGTPAQRDFNGIFREKAFETAVKHDVSMIFTYLCGFEMPSEREYLNSLHDMFTANGGRFFFVELSADLDERIRRNETEHRLQRKPSKQDIEWSRRDLIESAQRHKLNSDEGEYWFKNHLKIDNTYLSPDETADMIIKEYDLKPLDREEKEYRYGY